MLNPFYWYSIIWTVVLLLYGLGYSAINQVLSVDLLFFLLVSIIFSGFIGYLLKSNFRYHPLKENKEIGNTLTLVISILALTDLMYMHQIPLFAIAKGTATYGDSDVSGMPFVHTILTNLIVFYSSYLFYVFLETKRKHVLWKIIYQLSFFLIMFQKGILIFTLFIMANLSFAKFRYTKRRISKRKVLLLILFVILILYVNGGLANIRSGVGWNDDTYIVRVARVHNWPSWVPQQFIWAYTYVTTPLGNVNKLLSLFRGHMHIDIVLGTVIPMLFLKQLWPAAVVPLDTSVFDVEYMNAASGFSNAAIGGGVLGIWLFYYMVMVITISYVLFLRKRKYSSPMYAIFSAMVSFCFFYDTFCTAQTSLLPIYTLLFFALRKINIGNRRVIIKIGAKKIKI